MANPHINIMACSNVYIRMMTFKEKGDVEIGHSHTYDHATVLSNGSVKYQILNGFDGDVVAEKIFTAPDMIFVAKDKFHRLIALEPNTVCSCTHALRSIDEDLIPPDSFIESKHRVQDGDIRRAVEQKIGKRWSNMVHQQV